MSNNLRVGQKAPQFSGSSTGGLVNLASYTGKWVILLCSPTEFNTWRKNEFINLIKAAKTFQEKNAQIIAISMDKKASHLQWFYGTARLGSYAMPFPIVDDRTGTIGEKYGVFTVGESHPNPTSHLFIIAPDQTIAEIFTFNNVGTTQISEVLNRLTALQENYPAFAQRLENASSASSCPAQPIVGEYVLGNPSNVDARLLDFVIYAFALINPDGTLEVYSTRYLTQLSNLRLENPALRVILAIGGWGADGFSDAALTPTSRYNFAREAKRWVDEYDLDGIDIDWEYPGSSVAGIKSRPEDRENFTLLLTALRDVLGEDAWLSVAGTGEPSYIRNVEINKIAPIINYFNLMAYDFTAGETGQTAGRHQANLFSSDLSLGTYSIDNQVNNLMAAGLPSHQILLGIPFYARYGATDTKTYDEIRRDYLNKNGYTVLWDDVAKASYIVDSSGNFVYSFDSLLSIYYKGLYVLENCLGGMFSWQAGMDRANILANAMSQAMRDISQLEQSLGRQYYFSSKDRSKD